jgi:hypothetical protein
MILEILAIFLLLLLIHCASRISRRIERRRVVLYYVSKSDRTVRKRKGFGWARWSRQWLYETLKLFNSYKVR